MNQLNNRINLDRAGGAVENASKGVEKMSNASKKTPWHLRFAPGAILRNGLIAVLAIATALSTIPIEKAGAWITRDENGNVRSGPSPSRTPDPVAIPVTFGSTNSASTNSTAQLQHGDQVQWIRPIIEGGKRLPWRKIGQWFGFIGVSYAVSVGGSATWDAIKKEWRLPPGSASKGTVEARADVWLSKVDGEHTHWYSKSGDWAWQKVWRYDLNGLPIHNTHVESANKIRNYHYYDYSCSMMVWDEDNEIWRSSSHSSSGLHKRIYGSTGYDPDKINSFRNNGKPGSYYPDHDDYDKGKKGWFIWVGDNVKNYLEHEFRSTIMNRKDENLAAKAKDPKRKKDKFKPAVLVTLDDMTYESDGWNYERRSEKTFIQEELIAVENDSVDLGEEFIPRNTRWVKEQYQYNVSIVYWKVETEWTTGDIRVDRTDEVFEDKTVPIQYEVPEQQIDTDN